MKHIIKFQKFFENTQSTIDKILDKISSGEEISNYEKDILDKFSKDVDIQDVFVDSFNFLKSSFGNLMKYNEKSKSFGKDIDKLLLCDISDSEVYFEIIKNIVYVDQNIYNRLSGYYGLQKSDITEVVCDFLEKIYDIKVDKVSIFFKNDSINESSNEQLVSMWKMYYKLFDITSGIVSEYGELPESYWIPNAYDNAENIVINRITIGYLKQNIESIKKSFNDLYDGLEGWVSSGHSVSKYGNFNGIDSSLFK